MKKLLITASLVTAMASPALANQAQSVNGKVTDHYRTVVKEIPHTETVCKTIDVPIYGSVNGGGASAGDVLGGMIIGGLIGKGVTNKDNGAAAGAVIGGMIAADKKQSKQEVIGYRQEQRCTNQTTYDKEYREVYSHSTITFRVDGRTYTQKFYK